jgi:hypothetical protein
MAFELIVVCRDRVPVDLRDKWSASLAKHGIQCEIHPAFSPGNWGGGFLPFKVDVMPHDLIDADLLSPAISGFEVDFNEDTVFFRSAMGRTCTEFALLCLCAAEIAVMTSGEWHDPQTGVSRTAADSLQAARDEINATLAHRGSADRTQHPFEGWQ